MQVFTISYEGTFIILTQVPPSTLQQSYSALEYNSQLQKSNTGEVLS
jgi:hypothetical protein